MDWRRLKNCDAASRHFAIHTVMLLNKAQETVDEAMQFVNKECNSVRASADALNTLAKLGREAKKLLNVYPDTYIPNRDLPIDIGTDEIMQNYSLWQNKSNRTQMSTKKRDFSCSEDASSSNNNGWSDEKSIVESCSDELLDSESVSHCVSPKKRFCKNNCSNRQQCRPSGFERESYILEEETIECLPYSDTETSTSSSLSTSCDQSEHSFACSSSSSSCSSSVSRSSSSSPSPAASSSSFSDSKQDPKQEASRNSEQKYTSTTKSRQELAAIMEKHKSDIFKIILEEFAKPANAKTGDEVKAVVWKRIADITRIDEQTLPSLMSIDVLTTAVEPSSPKKPAVEPSPSTKPAVEPSPSNNSCINELLEEIARLMTEASSSPTPDAADQEREAQLAEEVDTLVQQKRSNDDTRDVFQPEISDDEANNK